jgi:hypothetical protein
MGADLLFYVVTIPGGKHVNPSKLLEWLDGRTWSEILDLQQTWFVDAEYLLPARPDANEPPEAWTEWGQIARARIREGITGLADACNSGHRYAAHIPIQNTNDVLMICGGTSFGDEPYEGWSMECHLIDIWFVEEQLGFKVGIVAPLREVPEFTTVEEANRWLEGRMVT